MIVLLIAVVSLLLFTMFLSYRVDELEFEKKLVQMDADMYKKIHEAEKHYTELYWSHYTEEQRKNRSKALLIKELQEENAELEELLAHKELELDNANSWADGWEEAYNRVIQEKIELEDKLKDSHDCADTWRGIALERLARIGKLEELEAKNHHLKLELEYYRQKYEGDYDPIE